MKKIRPSVLLILALAFQFTSQAADTAYQAKHSVSISVFRPFWREYLVRYEHRLDESRFLNLELAYQYPRNVASYENWMSTPLVIPYKRIVFHNIRVSAGPGFFLNEQNTLYLVMNLSYRYRFYQDKFYYNCTGMDSESVVTQKSEYHHNAGIMPQFGYKLPVITKSTYQCYFDFNASLGTYLSFQRHLEYGRSQPGCDINSYHPYFETVAEKIITLNVHFVLGINFGIAF